MIIREIYNDESYRGTMGTAVENLPFSIGDLVYFEYDNKRGIGMICENDGFVSIMGRMHISIYNFDVLKMVFPYYLVSNQMADYIHSLKIDQYEIGERGFH